MKFCAQWFMAHAAPSASSPGTIYRVTFQLSVGATCSCPAFDYAWRRSGGDVRECKHVRHVMAHACLWNEHYYDGGDRTLAPVAGSLATRTSPGRQCPRCGGPTCEVAV